jgi:glycosyltransferase involved in cell wall biosynthesis
MNILLINHYAGSLRHGMEYRPFYLGREWTRMGHRVAIVASSVSHVRTLSPRISGALTIETIDGLEYHWLKTPLYQSNGIRRAVNILAFVTQLYRFASYWVETLKPDLVISSSTHPLDNLPGRWIASRAGAKLIYEVHDLWPLSLIELGGMSTQHPFVRLIQWAEDYAYQNVDYVVSLLPKSQSHMHNHGLAPQKFVYIPNGVDVTEWASQDRPLPPEHKQILQSAKENARLLIGYAGAHGVANALDTVLDAAQLLKNDPVSFVLVGQGPEKTRLQDRCRKEGLGNVVFLPPVAKDTMPTLLRALDVAYIGLKSEPLFRYGVSPNKLIDYMMAGKPIIYAIAAGNDPVSEAGCGFSVTPQNATALAQVVKRLLILSPNSLRKMGERGLQYCLQHHDYRNLALQFLSAVT